MSQRYTILRTSQKSFIHPFSLIAKPMVEAFGEPVPKPTLEIADLSPRELRQLRSDPEIAAVAPAIPIKLIAPSEAPIAAATPAWGIEAVGAHQSSRDGDGVVVAVLDTGIDARHPAFAGVDLIQRDFTDEGADDRDGHGTHVAASIFGRDVDGQRIGVARGVKTALIGKVLSRDGGTSEALFQAIQWALTHADVISMSLGFDFPGYVSRLVAAGVDAAHATSQALAAYTANLRMFDAIMAVNRARDTFGLQHSAVVVAAAGNESRWPSYRIICSLPAAAEGIVSVGALARGAHGLRIAAFSNTMVDLCAPGVEILSARAGGGLVALSGTSMATPHVAGLAALWWQHLRAGNAPAIGRNVIAKLLASATADALAPDVDLADRGAGLAIAPP